MSIAALQLPEVEAQVNFNEFTDQIISVRDRRVNEHVESFRNRFEDIVQYETLNACFEVALNSIIQDETESARIISLLDRSRRENDFLSYTRGVYYQYRQNVVMNRLLLTLCAFYRLKAKNYYFGDGDPQRSHDRCIVRKHISCPECGEYAQRLVTHLELQGIKWDS